MNNTNKLLRWEKRAGKIQRYYQAYVTQDLFETWVLVKGWGGIATRQGRQVTLAFEARNDAEHALLRTAKHRRQRGYKMVASTH